MIYVDVSEPFAAGVDVSVVERAALAALEHQGAASDSNLTIVIGDDDLLQRLNLQYMGIDAPTDVLAFPAGYTDPDSGLPYLGDVLISYSRCQEQAAGAGHPVAAELQLLAVHGVLHLLGYDHLEQEEKARMWSAQAETLSELGLSINAPAD